MNYKDALYNNYVTGHIAQRKGVADLRALAIQSRIFDAHFGAFVPKPCRRAADLGCGPGTLVSWLHSRGCGEVYGVDFSAEQVANAHALGIPNVTQGDIFEFLASRQNFDLLFARDVMEHFERQMVFEFLRASHAALAEGGRLILQVPNAQSPYFGRVRYGDLTHELAFTGSSLRQVLAAAGFLRVSVHPWRPVGFDIKSRVRAMAWRAIEPLLKAPILIESGSKEVIVTMNLIAVAQK